MAVVDHRPSYQIRPTNKEPEWSSICNNVFDQYLDGDDIFALEGQSHERSSSDDSGDLFAFSGSSEQSAQTNATSPIPPWNDAPSLAGAATEARQPKAKAPVDFWAKKLHALEQNAAECEKRQQKLRSTKSHPDFLSLGGYPSPPVVPSSPTDQSLSVQRQRCRPAASGRKTPSQRSVTNARSVSRGRPVGVSKPLPGAAANSHATVRQRNVSPAKMMNPSRYRAGFKDVWAERIERSPKKFELRIPSQSFPDSPPPSGRSAQENFAAFGSPLIYPPVPGCDDQISPLANTFQQAARIHTPIASPLLSPGSNAASYFEAAPPLPSNPYLSQAVPLTDTAPLYPGDDQLAANKIQSFDFGFSSSPVEDAWAAAPFAEPSKSECKSLSFADDDPFGNIDTISGSQASNNFGLGISCNPRAISNYTTMQSNSMLPSTTYQPPPMSAASPFYVPAQPSGLTVSPTRPRQPNGLPNTPQRPRPSRSPSPPATESRSRRASSSKRASRHRRTKSTNSTPRHQQGGDKSGFVNFTPSDCNKILNGVAPSGSSKTKARREKEAADKRRRLSQAAMRAVIDAGGDVESLQKAGLIVG